MKNMIDYMKKYGHLSFKEKPFCEVDSMILVQLSYFDFANTLAEQTNFEHTLQECLEKDYDKSRVAGIWNPKKNDMMARLILTLPRFSHIKIGYYVNKIEVDNEKQFSAVAFLLQEGLYYIAYRGTDAHFIGWKEDLNLAYLENIPSQREAVMYLTDFASIYPGQYIVGGHSKGGNLATFASACVDEAIQECILTVYNHDGPGFLPEFYEKPSYQNIESKIIKTIPKDALVGLLLEPSNRYQVVASNAFLFVQHDQFNWVIEDDHPKYIQDVTKISKHTRKAITNWVNQMDMATRESFINTIYAMIEETKIERLSGFVKKLPRNLFIMNKAYKKLSVEERKIVRDALVSFLACYVGKK